MRKVLLMIMTAAGLVSCGTSGKVAKETVKTYVQPGAELLNESGALRAWAVGVSDSQMAAKKKAMVSASSQLAQTLNSVIYRLAIVFYLTNFKYQLRKVERLNIAVH